MRPLFVGEWNQDHVDWFMQKFQGVKKEIDARSIEQLFGSRKDDKFPEWCKSKADAFRCLMRLIVRCKLARVTQGWSESNNYRIKMVTPDHPYIDKVFDDEIYSSQLIAKPLQKLLDMLFEDEKFPSHPNFIQIARIEHISRCFKNSFLLYEHVGGDMESAFDDFHEKYIEENVLLSFEIIYMHQLVKILCKNLPEYRQYNYNEIFAFAFYCKFASELLAITGSKPKHSKSYIARNIREILTAITTNSDTSRQRVNVEKALAKALSLDDKNLCDVDFIHGFASGAWLYEISKDSGNSEVEKARVDWIDRFEALAKYHPSL